MIIRPSLIVGFPSAEAISVIVTDVIDVIVSLVSAVSHGRDSPSAALLGSHVGC